MSNTPEYEASVKLLREQIDDAYRRVGDMNKAFTELLKQCVHKHPDGADAIERQNPRTVHCTVCRKVMKY